MTEFPTVQPSGYFLLSLGFANAGSKPVSVPTSNYDLLYVRIRDKDGNEVKADKHRDPSKSFPCWDKLPVGGRTGYQFHAPGIDAKGCQLDLGSDQYYLKPGVYRIEADLDSTRVPENAESPKPADAWAGSIKLPPLTVEVLPKDLLVLETALEKKVLKSGDDLAPALVIKNVSEADISFSYFTPFLWGPAIYDVKSKSLVPIQSEVINMPVKIEHATIKAHETFALHPYGVKVVAPGAKVELSGHSIQCGAGEYSFAYQVQLVGAGKPGDWKGTLVSNWVTFNIEK